MENKKVYTAPEIELVILDNEISLALESVVPPSGPEEVNNLFQDKGADPYKTDLI